MEILFVYGTLKSDYDNNRLLMRGNAKLISAALTKEADFNMTGRGIPFVSKGGHNQISGEIYKLTKDLLEGDVDSLEGHPRWYKREKVPVVLPNGEEVSAWIYLNEEAGLSSAEAINGVQTYG